MKPETTVLYSQDPANGPYHEPDESIPNLQSFFLKNNVDITLICMCDFVLPRDAAGCVCRRQIAKWCNTCSSHSRYARDDKGLEQRHCIKFCLKTLDTQAETIRKIQQAFGDDAGWGSLNLKSGSTALKMAVCRRTVTSAPGDRQRAEMLMSLTKCGHWSWRTVVRLSGKLLMRLGSAEVPQTRF
jgi:hypothetical protein